MRPSLRNRAGMGVEHKLVTLVRLPCASIAISYVIELINFLRIGGCRSVSIKD